MNVRVSLTYAFLCEQEEFTQVGNWGCFVTADA